MKRDEQQLPLPVVEEVHLTPADTAIYFGSAYRELFRAKRRVVRGERFAKPLSVVK